MSVNSFSCGFMKFKWPSTLGHENMRMNNDQKHLLKSIYHCERNANLLFALNHLFSLCFAVAMINASEHNVNFLFKNRFINTAVYHRHFEWKISLCINFVRYSSHCAIKNVQNEILNKFPINMDEFYSQRYFCFRLFSHSFPWPSIWSMCKNDTKDNFNAIE